MSFFQNFVAADVSRLNHSGSQSDLTHTAAVSKESRTSVMRRSLTLGCCVIMALLVISCATQQSRFFFLGEAYPPKPENFEIQIFRQGSPTQPFVRISRLDVHLERTGFSQATFNDALPELKRQARRSGADAIVAIEEKTSVVGETRIYHVTATGIRYPTGQ